MVSQGVLGGHEAMKMKEPRRKSNYYYTIFCTYFFPFSFWFKINKYKIPTAILLLYDIFKIFFSFSFNMYRNCSYPSPPLLP